MVATRPSTPSSAATPRRGRWALSLLLALTACALGGIAVLPAAALAVAPPIALDAPDNGETPQIAYDPSTQTTYVAWSNRSPGRRPMHGAGRRLRLLGWRASVPRDSKFKAPPPPFSAGSLFSRRRGGGDRRTASGRGQPRLGVAGRRRCIPVGQQRPGERRRTISPVSLFYTSNNAVSLNGADVGLQDDHSTSSATPRSRSESPASLFQQQPKMVASIDEVPFHGRGRRSRPSRLPRQRPPGPTSWSASGQM